MNYFIGLDIGTSSVKGVLMTADDRVAKSVRKGFSYRTPDNGRLELDPAVFLDICCQSIRELAENACGGTVAGICASSASGNLLLLDKTNTPLTNIISWQDQRVTDEVNTVLPHLDHGEHYRRVGWAFDDKTFPLAQLCHIKEHRPELLEQSRMVCMSTEYLYHTLTGKWGISTSAGTPFYLIDQNSGRYLSHLLDIFGLDQTQVPPVLPAGQILGGVQKEMAGRCGVLEGTPVILGTFDHPSAARGAGILNEGEMLLSCGTSWVVFMPVSSREKGIAANVLVDPFLSPGGNWAVMAPVTSLSGRIRLYVSRYLDASEDCFRTLSALAAQSVPGANGLCINMPEEPDDENIHRFSKADVARAIMEGTVRMLKSRLDDLAAKGITADSAVMVGGPSEDGMWVRLIEDICEIPVRVLHGAYAGAVGAAVLAGIGVGEYRDEADAQERFASTGQANR